MMLNDFTHIAFSNPIEYAVSSRDDKPIEEFVVDWRAKKNNLNKLKHYCALGAEVSYFIVKSSVPMLRVFVVI